MTGKTIIFGIVILLGFAIGNAQEAGSGRTAEPEKPPVMLRLDISSGDVRGQLTAEPVSTGEAAAIKEGTSSAKYVRPLDEE